MEDKVTFEKGISVESGKTYIIIEEGGFEQELDKARKEELEWLLKNCSGGGNWRRIVNERLSKLKDNK